MAEAEPVIRAVLPDANVPTSIRRGGPPVVRGTTAERDPILTAWLADNDRPHAEAAAIAKAYASDAAFDAAQEAVNIFAGYGYMNEYPVEKLMRDRPARLLLGGGEDVRLDCYDGPVGARRACTRASART